MSTTENITMLTHEDAAIVASMPFYTGAVLPLSQDRIDYRAMLAREEHCADSRAPCASYRRPGQWVNMTDALRAHFRKEFGRGIASRWFS